MLTKIIKPILALFLAVIFLYSCAKSDMSNVNNLDTEKITLSESTFQTSEIIESDLPEKNFEGKDFMFYVMGKERNMNNYSVEIFSENESGDPINDAVYRRNVKLEDKYNFKIKETASTDDSLVSKAQKNIQAGDDIYQVLMFNLLGGTQMVQKGMLTDLNSTDYIDINKPWWDSQLANDLSISNKLYYAMGDINIMDNNATWAVFFNKTILTDNNIELPYTYVKNNSWTLDKYLEMAQAVAKDLDGNGTMDPNDLWGTVGENYNAYMLFISTGERITNKSSDDIPELVPPTDRTVSAIEKIYAIMLDTSRSTINAGDYVGKYGNVFDELIRGNFKKDKALFYIAGLLSFTLLRDMESEYGMVPMPMLSNDQTQYYTSLNYSNTSTVCIPVSNQKISDTAFVIESMAAESPNTLTHAYYETALERKYMRDDESRMMLNIILKSRTYDLASLYDWGGIYMIFDSMVSGKNIDYISKYDAVKEKAMASIAKTIDEINNFE